MKLEKLQNEALRTILGAPSWMRVLTMLQETGLLSISEIETTAGGIRNQNHQSYKSCQLQKEFIRHISDEDNTHYQGAS